VILSEKQKEKIKQKRTGSMTQLVPTGSNHEFLSSNSSTRKKEKKEGRKERRKEERKEREGETERERERKKEMENNKRRTN
jgi:hypothetical protein